VYAAVQIGPENLSFSRSNVIVVNPTEWWGALSQHAHVEFSQTHRAHYLENSSESEL